MTSDKNDSAPQKTIVIASSPTGRILRDSLEWQHLKLNGKDPDVVIVDEATPISEHKWPETFPDIDYAEIESRFFGLYPGVEELTSAMKRMSQSFKLTGDELRSALQNLPPETFMTKDERRHAAHPTEKNPNHPRFQNQPTRPSRGKSRKRR